MVVATTDVSYVGRVLLLDDYCYVVVVVSHRTTTHHIARNLRIVVELLRWKLNTRGRAEQVSTKAQFIVRNCELFAGKRVEINNNRFAFGEYFRARERWGRKQKKKKIIRIKFPVLAPRAARIPLPKRTRHKPTDRELLTAAAIGR